MTDNRAEALMKLVLDEVPAFALPTLLGHLQDALRDRGHYKRLVRHVRDGLLKYLAGLDCLDPFDGQTVAYLARQLNDDRTLLETELGIAPGDPPLPTWEEVDALQRQPLSGRSDQTEASR
jgi:hypothetical protein